MSEAEDPRRMLRKERANEVTVEIEGKDKPACVAEVISRLYEA